MPPRRVVFESNYNEIMGYIDEKEGLRLPRKFKRTRYLAKWLDRQYKRENVPDDEREKLELLQKLRDSNHGKEMWKYFFGRLIEYKEEYHSLVILKKDAENRQLYDWSGRQRKAAKESRLLPERREDLERIGFNFGQKVTKKPRFTKKQEATWYEKYKELFEYKEQHGHCNVSFNDEKNQPLAKWVSYQRCTYWKGKMDDTREQRLNNIGFVWRVNSSGKDGEDTAAHGDELKEKEETGKGGPTLIMTGEKDGDEGNPA
jgi:hypothetical protein